MKVEAATSLSKIAAREERYQLATYKKMPIVAERGEGVWIYTSEGDKYLDLYGGHAVAGTGHCHPHVVARIRAQSERLLFYSNLVYSEARAQAAEKLVSLAPETRHGISTQAPVIGTPRETGRPLQPPTGRQTRRRLPFPIQRASPSRPLLRCTASCSMPVRVLTQSRPALTFLV